jgi:hypothetical protein
MNPRIVIVVYRPLPGKEGALQSVVAKHLGVLKTEKLVTDRAPIVMKAKDGSIVEVFEWRSAEAIAAAHTNPNVLALWDEFGAACEYEKPVNVAEFHNLFSEFEPLQF